MAKKTSQEANELNRAVFMTEMVITGNRIDLLV
jgi:hypothetical protein